ncbi:MAG: murein transglycosylase [Rhodospirillaceae bacterium]|nr:murein transglycosylase [Rhodospirillaceae bacterium]
MLPRLLSPRAAVTALALLAAACAPPSPPVKPADSLTLTPTEFGALSGWERDDHQAALAAFRRSCARLLRLADDRPMEPDRAFGLAGDWKPACTAAATAADARGFFERWFRPYKAGNNQASAGLFTGYYEPELRGSHRPGGRFTVPLYRRPPDLVTVDLGLFKEEWRGQRLGGRVVSGALRPYANRAEIDAGAITGRNLEMLWVDDAVDAFFLHIQGSGRVVLEDGSVVRVGFDSANGQPYYAIGRELVSRGVPASDVSMQSIRAWLAAHPDEAAAVMAKNPSYVFFRALDGDGPLGAEGTVLTPGRSLAVDRAFLTLGLPVWLDTEDPLDPRLRVRRLLISQDTGGAIRGPVRGDIFWGYGAEAAERAGRMRSSGEYWLLIPRTVAERRIASQ